MGDPWGCGFLVRRWINVEDHCRAIDQSLRKGRLGEIYNVGGTAHRTNLDVIGGILKLLRKPESLITYVEDRAGHDRRYAMGQREDPAGARLVTRVHL